MGSPVRPILTTEGKKPGKRASVIGREPSSLLCKGRWRSEVRVRDHVAVTQRVPSIHKQLKNCEHLAHIALLYGDLCAWQTSVGLSPLSGGYSDPAYPCEVPAF